jgi:hypothetical protein
MINTLVGSTIVLGQALRALADAAPSSAQPGWAKGRYRVHAHLDSISSPAGMASLPDELPTLLRFPMKPSRSPVLCLSARERACDLPATTRLAASFSRASATTQVGVCAA